MNYQKIYNNLIHSAQLRPNIPQLEEYSEVHHVLPRSMGGSNSPDNLVKLTAREHFVAHWLLWKIHRNKSMAWAFTNMIADRWNNGRYKSSRGFAAAKKALSIIKKIPTGKKHTEEHKKKIGDAQRGVKRSKEFCEKNRNRMLGSNNPMFGKKGRVTIHSAETIERLRIICKKDHYDSPVLDRLLPFKEDILNYGMSIANLAKKYNCGITSIKRFRRKHKQCQQ